MVFPRPHVDPSAWGPGQAYPVFWGHQPGTSSAPPSSFLRFLSWEREGEERERVLSDHVACARLIARARVMVRARQTAPRASVLARGLAVGLVSETLGETRVLLARMGIALSHALPCSLPVYRCARWHTGRLVACSPFRFRRCLRASVPMCVCSVPSPPILLLLQGS